MTMFAGMLELDRKVVKALRITDPYSIHRAVYGMFPDVRNEQEKASGEASSGILFADLGGDARSRRIITLSDRPPEPERLDPIPSVSTREVTDGFLQHDYYRFKVRTNPVRRTGNKAVPVRGEEAVVNWFQSNAEQKWGFKVRGTLDIRDQNALHFRGKNNAPITLNQAWISGVLEVTERDTFLASFKKGIGRARAFGFGLLQIVPVTP